jgi:hypothetical protein
MEYQVEYSIARQVRHHVGPFAGAGMAAPEHATAKGMTLDAIRDQLRSICEQGRSLTIEWAEDPLGDRIPARRLKQIFAELPVDFRDI